MSNRNDIEKQLRDGGERSAFEREEIESMQRINGHTYTSSFKPDQSEVEILIQNTKDVILECKNGDTDLSMDAELVAQEILTRSNKQMMIRNLTITDSKFKFCKVKQLPPYRSCDADCS